MKTGHIGIPWGAGINGGGEGDKAPLSVMRRPLLEWVFPVLLLMSFPCVCCGIGNLAGARAIISIVNHSVTETICLCIGQIDAD